MARFEIGQRVRTREANPGLPLGTLGRVADRTPTGTYRLDTDDRGTWWVTWNDIEAVGEPVSSGADLAHGDRHDDYGHPAESFTRIAALWSALLGTDITARDVGLMMVLFKVSREKGKPKADNLTDIEGYVECLRMIDRKGRA